MSVPSEILDPARAARRVTVLTGAGMSAESGVPTFRDARAGLWSEFDATSLATPEGWRADAGPTPICCPSSAPRVWCIPRPGCPDLARGHGVPVVEIGPEPTEISDRTDHVWRTTAAVGLPELVAALR